MTKRDYSNAVFGKWSVLQKSEKTDTRNRVFWLCKCQCGTIRSIRQDCLSGKASVSCGQRGCHNNLTGRTFDYLFVEKMNINDDKFSYLHQNGKFYTKTTYDCLCRCGRRVLIPPEGLLSGNNKSCGCLKIEKTKLRIREKHPNWKPEISDEVRMKRRQDKTPLYTEWRKAVYKRDGYKCKLCGKKGKINAHHIDGWNWAVDIRYAIQNGVTLCAGKKRGCHDRFHKEYGKGDNTRYQFNDFALTYFNKSLLDLNL